MKKQASQFPDWLKPLFVLLLTIGFSWLILSKVLLVNQDPLKEPAVQNNPQTPHYTLVIGTHSIQVEIRRTEAEQELGLSWRKALGENEGMVFVYQDKQKVLYWMKGMQFPLDFVFAAAGKVVEVMSNIQQPTSQNPAIQTVAPKEPVDMVIEVNAGWANDHQIKVGDLVTLQN